ncbi:MAG: Maf family protein, partial [Lachnospiraceae bacterium]
VYYQLDAGQEDEDLVVIGADTIVVAHGRIMGKPKNRAMARRMISKLQGRSHYVYTGVTVMTCDKALTFVERTKVKVYKMNKKQIDEYLNTREYVDKAGAYGIQGAFAAYVKSIKGDYNNVVGLPVGRLCYELRKEGII